MIEAARNRINSRSICGPVFGNRHRRRHPGGWPNHCGRAEAGDRDASLRSADEVGLWPVPRESSRWWVTDQFWQSLCRERSQTTQETVVKFRTLRTRNVRKSSVQFLDQRGGKKRRAGIMSKRQENLMRSRSRVSQLPVVL